MLQVISDANCSGYRRMFSIKKDFSSWVNTFDLNTCSSGASHPTEKIAPPRSVIVNSRLGAAILSHLNQNGYVAVTERLMAYLWERGPTSRAMSHLLDFCRCVHMFLLLPLAETRCVKDSDSSIKSCDSRMKLHCAVQKQRPPDL